MYTLKKEIKKKNCNRRGALEQPVHVGKLLSNLNQFSGANLTFNPDAVPNYKLIFGLHRGHKLSILHKVKVKYVICNAYIIITSSQHICNAYIIITSSQRYLKVRLKMCKLKCSNETQHSLTIQYKVLLIWNIYICLS